MKIIFTVILGILGILFVVSGIFAKLSIFVGAIMVILEFVGVTTYGVWVVIGYTIGTFLVAVIVTVLSGALLHTLTRKTRYKKEIKNEKI